MYEIEVADRQTRLAVDPDWVWAVVHATLQAQSVSAAEIDIALVDDATIQALNRDHLQHDYPTDVISFLYDSSSPTSAPSRPALRGADCHIEGEVIVSTDTAIRAAAQANWPPLAELALYLVHGVLHLCGYDDLTPEEQQVMRDREQAILQIWNLTPHYEA